MMRGVRKRFALDPAERVSYSQGMNYQDRITIEPGKRGGKPCIRGLRITVYDVLEISRPE